MEFTGLTIGKQQLFCTRIATSKPEQFLSTLRQINYDSRYFRFWNNKLQISAFHVAELRSASITYAALEVIIRLREAYRQSMSKVNYIYALFITLNQIMVTGSVGLINKPVNPGNMRQAVVSRSSNPGPICQSARSPQSTNQDVGIEFNNLFFFFLRTIKL